eukprot:2638596-Lingulodinium_polyedra.AAC.1
MLAPGGLAQSVLTQRHVHGFSLVPGSGPASSASSQFLLRPVKGIEEGIEKRRSETAREAIV